jgi:outer membrane protein TolC
MRSASSVALVTLYVLACPHRTAAQQPVTPLQLSMLHDAAIAADARSREFDLLIRQSDLRLRNIAATRLPTLSVEGQAQYQSDVPIAPISLPNGRPLFSPPKATYDSFLRFEQRLFDPARGPQSSLERAQLAEQQARVRTALFTLRQQVNDAFFAAALLQERVGALQAVIADLEARLNEVGTRVRQGVAIPAESATVEATLLQRQQDRDELAANRRAALARLSTLTGRQIGESQALALPDLWREVEAARRAPAELRARPEHEQFARTAERLARQQEVAAAQERPRVNTFARVGYGRPGLNFIDDEFDSYAVGGVQLQWRAWSWGSGEREREALRLQQQVVAADQAAFAKALTEAIAGDEAAVDRLRGAIETDARIVALREQVEASARVRLREGVLTASEYVDRNSDLLQARFALATHRVELAAASARLLTTLGLEVR